MITIIDYGMGNLASIRNMLNRIGIASQITSEKRLIEQATKIILPGVGAFDQAMNNIRSLELEELLKEKIVNHKTPILGICLGMQILMEESEEGGTTKGLSVIEGKVKRFVFDHTQKQLKVPHMGWNDVISTHEHPLLNKDSKDLRFYFVHGYYVAPADKQFIIGETEYGSAFCSVVAKENIMGVQFHPEKSHAFGMRLLQNFSAL